MSQLDDLITEHCPEGVEYRDLGDVGQFLRGNGLQKKDLTDDGLGAIHYGQIFTTYGTSTASTKSYVNPENAARLRRAKPGDLVIATTSENDEDVCKAVAWVGDEEIVVSGDAHVFTHDLDPLFAAYLFQTEHFQMQKRRFVTGTKVRRVSGGNLARIKIPVPAREVQAAVAEILNKMEALEATLEATLEAELAARRQQYEHYRNSLLAFEGRDDVPHVPLRDLGAFHRGRRFTKADFAESGIPCIHYGEIYTHYGVAADTARSALRPDLDTRLRFAEPGDVIVVDVGETVEDVGKAVAWLGDQPAAIHDHSYALRHDLNPTYVSYCMQTPPFQSQKAMHVARTKVKTLLIDGYSKIAIPVPPRSEQDAIVAQLNAFDSLVNDLSSGLPAEIAARRKQYEHYRDRLLKFKERSA